MYVEVKKSHKLIKSIHRNVNLNENDEKNPNLSEKKLQHNEKKSQTNVKKTQKCKFK